MTLTPSGAPTPESRPRLVATWAAGLALLHLLVALFALMPPPFTGGDNAVYLSLGRSLLQGGYHDLFDPGLPRHTQYPPGYPAIIAAALSIGVRPWPGLQVLGCFLSAVGVALSYLWLRGRDARVALPLAGLIAVMPGFVVQAGVESADVPFWGAMMTCLIFLDRLPDRGGRTAMLTGGLAGVAYLIRSAAAPLVVGPVLWLASKRRWREAALLAAVAGVAVVPWLWFSAGQASYSTAFFAVDPYNPAAGTLSPGSAVARVITNVVAYGTDHLPRILTGYDTWPAVALGCAVVALAIPGWLFRLRSAGSVEVAVALYAGMILLWPAVWAGERFILPLLPAVLLYSVEGFRAVAARLPASAARLLSAAALVLLILAAVAGTTREVRLGITCRRLTEGQPFACQTPAFRDYLLFASEARETLPAGSVVMSRKRALFWSESGFQGVAPPFSPAPAELIAAARTGGARYLLLDTTDEVGEVYVTAALVGRPDAFCVMYSRGPGRATLFGIHPAAHEIPDVTRVPGEPVVQQFRYCGSEYWLSPEARARHYGPVAP